MNGLDGSPVVRVLVTMNGRSVLTDSQGRFAFPGVTDTQASVTLTKPGYAQTNDPSGQAAAKRLTDLDADAELRIYPDAIITGTVTGSDGLPLSGVTVSLRRAVFGPSGLTWVPARAAQTDLHGEYRFREPAGLFQLTAGYVARSRDTGQVILPVSFPDNSAGGNEAFFEIGPGQEKHFDLRPRTGPAYLVAVRIEEAEAERGAQFTASTSGGDAFLLQATGTGQGTYQLQLPRGTYTLHVRVDTRDTGLDGSTKLTVTGPRTDPAVLHLEPATSLPVELAPDPASGTLAMATATTAVTQPPDLRQFNLHLHTIGQSAGMNADIPIRQNSDKTYEFRVPPGRYRLQAGGNGAGWYVESASYGTSNLMSNEIAISSGGAGSAIRLVVNNTFGMVSGTVKFPATSNDPIDGAWVYLIPATATLAPINPIRVANTGAPTGTFSTRLPLGSYLAVAFDHSLQADLRDPDVIAKLSTAAQPFEVSTSATATVELEVLQQKESGP